jgi:hypothetical protein
MSATREDLFKSALELSEADRLLLATELLDSVSDAPPGCQPADDPEFEAELERRDNDGSLGISWDAVQAQLRADLNRD